VSAAVKKLDGIESVDVSINDKRATIKCKPNSKTTVEESNVTARVPEGKDKVTALQVVSVRPCIRIPMRVARRRVGSSRNPLDNAIRAMPKWTSRVRVPSTLS
jgi:hypothetical protein